MPPSLPPDISKVVLRVRDWEGSRVWRTYRTMRLLKGAIFFGRNATERFDDPLKIFGVCYLGVDEYAAFIESFRQRTRFKCVDESEILQSSLAAIEVTDRFKLLDITGSGLAVLGQTGELASSSSHTESQQFSHQIYEHDDLVDGILYRARHDPDRLCIALYDRAQHKIAAVNSQLWADHDQLPDILEHYDLGLI